MEEKEDKYTFSGFDKISQTFLQIVELLNSDLSFSQLLTNMGEKINHMLSFNWYTVFSFKKNKLIVESIIYPENEKIYDLEEIVYFSKSNFIKKILEMANPLCIPDLQKNIDFIDDKEKNISLKYNIHSKLGIPIIVSNKIEGIFLIESKEIDLYQSSHIFLAISFASYLAIAFQNQIHKEEQKKRLTELECLNIVLESMNKSIEINELCNLLGNAILKLLNCDVVYIGYLDKNKQKIYTPFFSVYGINKEIPPLKVGEGLTSILLREKKPIIINSSDSTTLIKLVGKVMYGNPPKSWVGIPLISNGEAIGIISVQQYDTENYFSDSDIELLKILANPISFAIEKAYIFNEMKQRESEAKTIAEISREITSFLDFNKVIQKIIDIVFSVISQTAVALYLKKEDGLYYGVAAKGKDAEALLNDCVKPSEGIIGTSIALKRTIIENSIAHNYAAMQVPGTKEGAENEKLMSIPLFVGNEVEGALAIWRSESEDNFNIKDKQFAEGIASSITIALQNAKLFESIKQAKKEAEYTNLMKTQFLSNMSHELRTPLNSIINFAYIIQKTLPEKDFPDELDMLRRIEESGKYLLTLINEILDLAKIEAGKMELFKEYFDITELIGTILSHIQTLINHKPITIITDIDQNLPKIYADKTRLREILLNLLSNSAKFTNEGYIKLIIKLQDSSFLFCVEDTGIGIKKEDIEKAFIEFVQIDGSSSRQSQGTGLGLPISKKFIEMHGGKIWVESEYQKGSKFFFTIPLVILKKKMLKRQKKIQRKN